MTNFSNKLSGFSNNYLLEKLKQGDKKVYTLVFDYYYSGLVVFADQYLNDIELSEDVVQSVFVKLWENKQNLKSDSIKYYLINSVKNSCIDIFRKEGTRKKYSSRVKFLNDNYVDEFWTEAELKEMIDKAIDQLPPKCKEIFLLSRFENLKSKEIAEKLQISHRTVEAQIAKALKIMRRELKDYLFNFFFIFF